MTEISSKELPQLLPMLDDLEHFLVQQIRDFREQIFSARPMANDPEYEMKIKVYHAACEAAAVLIDRLQEATKGMLTLFQKFLRELWATIARGEDPNCITRQFEHDLQDFEKKKMDPAFAEIDKITAHISEKLPRDSKL